MHQRCASWRARAAWSALQPQNARSAGARAAGVAGPFGGFSPPDPLGRASPSPLPPRAAPAEAIAFARAKGAPQTRWPRFRLQSFSPRTARLFAYGALAPTRKFPVGNAGRPCGSGAPPPHHLLRKVRGAHLCAVSFAGHSPVFLVFPVFPVPRQTAYRRVRFFCGPKGRLVQAGGVIAGAFAAGQTNTGRWSERGRLKAQLWCQQGRLTGRGRLSRGRAAIFLLCAAAWMLDRRGVVARSRALSPLPRAALPRSSPHIHSAVQKSER